MFFSIPFFGGNRAAQHLSENRILKPGTTIHLARASLKPTAEGAEKLAIATSEPTSTELTTTRSSSPSPNKCMRKRSKRGKGMGLPFEGQLYDDVTMSNFVDLEKYKLMMSVTKSIAVNKISTLLDADLPARISLSGKLGTFGADGLKIKPIGRIGFNLRLLDLGASDTRQKGFLRFKASARSDGRVDHGFEIDRKIQVMSSRPSTMIYGNVAYKTSNKHVNKEWKTVSSFGFHQDFRLFGVRFAARAGLTPEGKFVYDLRL